MIKFTTSQVLLMLDINRNTFQVWLEKKYITPTVKASTKQGDGNLFSEDDLCKIAAFKFLIKAGFKRDLASKIVNV